MADAHPSRPRLLLAVTLAEAGGAQAYVRDLLPALADHFEVTVAAHGPGPLEPWARDAGCAYVPLRHVRRPISPLRDARGLLELVQLLRRTRPAIVHLNSSKMGILGRLAARLTRVPATVFTVHGWAFGAETGISARAYRLADRLVRDLADTVVCVSANDLAAGLAAGTCSEGHSVVIPNAVDLRRFRPHPRPTPHRVSFVSVGRLQAPKDFGTLVRAFARIGDRERLQLTIVGDGPERDAVAAEIARLGVGDAVRLAGHADDVAAVLAEADVFVLSSRSEGMPISALEAMAAGLPVVASEVGGIPEIVEDGRTGILVPPGDERALAAAIVRLAGDPGLGRSLGDAGRAIAEREHGLDGWRRRHLELYERLLSSARRSRDHMSPTA